MAPDARSGKKKASVSKSTENGFDSEMLGGSQDWCEGEIGGNSTTWLLKEADLDHKPENYEDVKSDYHPALFSALERHLPSHMLDASKDEKLQFLSKVISRYAPRVERNRVQGQREYRERLKDYKPLHKELYTLNPDQFFVQSFIDAFKEDNTQERFKGIVMESTPGVYTFEMLQKGFCELLIDEVENFEKWADATKLDIVRPNTMNKYGVVLDDFGLNTMLGKLMAEFGKPLASVLFPDVGGSTLDTHHGFVVEYSKERDVDLGFHVDDSEVTLNVCLGKQFTGGELFLSGVRCEKHVNDETHTEETFEYSHIPGQAVMHAGCHRHGVRAIASGHRTNLILWCRSAVFRELKKHQRDFSSWCGKCFHQKEERRALLLEARQQVEYYNSLRQENRKFSIQNEDSHQYSAS